MKRRLVKVAALATVSVSLVFTDIPRAIAECCDHWGAPVAAIFIQQGAAVVVAVTASVGTVVEQAVLLSDTFSKGVAQYGAETGRQSAEQRTIAQGTVAAHTQLYMQERAGEAMERGDLPAVASETVANTALIADQAPSLSAKVTSYDAAFMDAYFAPGNTTPMAVINRHVPYCSSDDVALGRCSQAASQQLQNADVNVNTLLNPGSGQYDTYSDEERDAALAFVQNVVHPVAEHRLAGNPDATDQGRVLDSQVLSDQATLSLAAHSFDSLIANRTRRRLQ
ncbi:MULTISPECIES: hypothetical protein [Burkholderia cepacia complex]|uniref:hypothetical protein n=1 Tax=Burkholderia cepacia complex TaxID=87882 RepID=UPI000AED6A8D|nr:MULTISPECIES: hypothetical protein [Burkholderia cepacia complex]MBR7919721.1 hypothetical protein [Burkholderia vietnamiensis]MBR8205224.1 hypothetical protein [Burkholderia vietnamiensis]HDR9132021.1 hypothetical protein [Burkholderia vietnamiensis]